MILIGSGVAVMLLGLVLLFASVLGEMPVGLAVPIAGFGATLAGMLSALVGLGKRLMRRKSLPRPPGSRGRHL
jgi:hypothetical protein